VRVIFSSPENATPMIPTKNPKRANQFESIALLLQGGGALGAYQAGVYEALHEAEVAPDWVAGISIGAINGAIIAGNKMADRVPRLRGFWEQITSCPSWSMVEMFNPVIQGSGDRARTLWGHISAMMSVTNGAPGFFTPRLIPPWFMPEGAKGADSYYDTVPLKATLEKFIDFGILNSGAVRYSTTAVNIRTGNYVDFESNKQTITPEHIMASGALPPALPAVTIEGESYWDGGIISNTPLQLVMDESCCDTLIFQVDLWSARGEVPNDLLEVMTRQKEIQYSSRTRSMTNTYKRAQKMQHAFAKLHDRLPPKLRKSEEMQTLSALANPNVYNIVHLIYRARHYEGFTKDYEFSRLSMEEHWKSGYNDTVRSLRHPEIFSKPKDGEGLQTFDVAEN
jgi:NTE family protein